MRVSLVCAMIVVLAATAAAEMPAATLVAEPNEPEARLPPRGRSLFDELFGVSSEVVVRGEGRVALPFPFERLLDHLNEEIAPAEATTVLIPLGRSLQRFSADPDYFGSPRIVLGIPEDAGAPDRPLLRDRLFLGYHERAQVIEVIAYNETAGRFEFQVVHDYAAGLRPRVEYADRPVCVECHQAHGPIFPTALWSETNANPEVAARLAGLGRTFHGVPVQGGVDRADALDRSTDRSARLAFVNALWAAGCGAPEEPEAIRCRGALLLAALRYRLGGERWSDGASNGALADRLSLRLAELSRGGLGTPSPDLPNRDPLAEIDAGVPARAAIEPEGMFDPSVPRPAVSFWRPPRPLGFAVGDVAAFFADADIVGLDEALARREGTEVFRRRARCRAQTVGRDAARREVRLECAGETIALQGYVVFDGDRPVGGLVRSLALGERAPVHRLVVAGGSSRRVAGGMALELELREAGLGLSGRSAEGERLSPLLIELRDDDGTEVEVAVLDDLAPLRLAIDRMVEAAEADPAAALGAGPLHRRAVLAELRSALGAD